MDRPESNESIRRNIAYVSTLGINSGHLGLALS